MKIAILTDLFYPYQLGGAERQFYELAVRLAKKHDVHVFTLNVEGCPYEETINNIHIHRFGYRQSLKKRSLFALATFFFKIPSLINRLRKFDVIHANQIAALFSFFRYLIKKPFVLTIHDLYWDQWKKYYSFPFYYAGKAIELFYSKLFYSRIITVSNESKRKIRLLGFNSKIEVLPNGIDFNYINKIKAKKSNHIIYVGRLVNYKNVGRIIEAMKELNKAYPKLELHIIGSGPDEDHLRELAGGNKNIKFLGYVSEDRKFEEIKSSHAFVSMSSVEGFGISLLEAMACGTPVIAKRLPAYDEFCTAKNSLLIDENDLEKVLTGLLKNTAAQKRLAEEGMKTAKRFDWDNVVARLEEIYKSVMG